MWYNNDLNYNIPTPTVSYDTYNHYLGINLPVIFYGPNGQTCKVIYQKNQYYIVVTQPNGTTTIYYLNQNENITINNINDITKLTFYGDNGNYVKVIKKKNNKFIVVVIDKNNVEQIFYETNFYANKPNNFIQNNTVPQSDTTQPTEVVVQNTTPQNDNYYPSNNKKKPYIPNNNLYMLKSEIVTPTCPVCKESIIYNKNSQQNKNKNKNNYNNNSNNTNIESNSSADKCPPCPACERCPEPAFECKKVPNYNSKNSNFLLPVPVLNDFSSFGM